MFWSIADSNHWPLAIFERWLFNGDDMARRTYMPHISVEPPGADWAIQGVRYWQCVGYGYTGIGTMPREAYDNWYQKFIRG